MIENNCTRIIKFNLFDLYNCKLIDKRGWWDEKCF